MIEQGDLPNLAQRNDMVDGQLRDLRDFGKRRVERCIDIGEAAGEQQMGAPGTRFSPQAE